MVESQEGFTKQLQNGVMEGDKQKILGAGVAGAIGSVGLGTLLLVIAGIALASIATTIVLMPMIIAVGMPILTYMVTSKITNMSLEERLVASLIAGIGGFLLLSQQGVTIFMLSNSGLSTTTASGIIGDVFGIGSTIYSLIVGVLLTVLALGTMFVMSTASGENKFVPLIAGIFGMGITAGIAVELMDISLSTGVQTTGFENPITYTQAGAITLAFIIGIGFVITLLSERIID